MRLAKRSNAFNRLYNKFYKFNYISCLIGCFLRKGFKLNAYKIIFKFIYTLKIKYKLNILLLLNNTFKKYIPLFSFLSKKIAANIYYLPWLINKARAKSLIIRWFVKSSLNRSENNILDKLISEFHDITLGYGKTVKCIEDHYSLSLKNRPFLRFLKKRRKVFLSRLKKFGIK